MPHQVATMMLNRSGVSTNGGTKKIAAAAPSAVPSARYSAFERVAPTNGFDTM